MKKRADNRIRELDFLRGIAILLMLTVHIAYAAHVAAGMAGVRIGQPLYAFSLDCYAFYRSGFGKSLQMLCGVLFALLSGVTSSFSTTGRRLGKAVKYFLIAMILTVVTRLLSDLFSTRMTIIFGVVHMLSISAALYALVMLPIRSNAARVTVPAVLGVTIVGIGVVFDLKNVPVSTNLLAPIGIVGPRFFSADFYPLIPWAGVFLLGGALGAALYPRRTLLPRSPQSLFPRFNKIRPRPISALGRFSIQIYLTHQVVLVGLFFVLYRIVF